jgi:hypothetical protein
MHRGHDAPLSRIVQYPTEIKTTFEESEVNKALGRMILRRQDSVVNSRLEMPPVPRHRSFALLMDSKCREKRIDVASHALAYSNLAKLRIGRSHISVVAERAVSLSK